MDEASAHSEESFADLLRVRPNLETGRRPRPARRLARLLDALALEVRVQEPWWHSRVSKRISYRRKRKDDAHNLWNRSIAHLR